MMLDLQYESFPKRKITVKFVDVGREEYINRKPFRYYSDVTDSGILVRFDGRIYSLKGDTIYV